MYSYSIYPRDAGEGIYWGKVELYLAVVTVRIVTFSAGEEINNGFQIFDIILKWNGFVFSIAKHFENLNV